MVIDQLEKVGERLAALLPEILFAASFWGVGFKISPLSLQKLISLCPLSHLSSDAFVLALRPSWSSVAVPCFCTLFLWMDLGAACNVDDQGVAAVGLMLGIMQLFLPLSLMIVQPVGNTAHRRTGLRDSWLVLDWNQDITLQPAGRAGWLLSREWSANLKQAGCSVNLLSYSWASRVQVSYTVFGVGQFKSIFLSGL